MASERKITFNIDFIKWRFVGIAVSIFFMSVATYKWIDGGEDKYGVDFRGGAEVIIQFNEKIEAGEIRQALEDGGIPGSTVQKFQSFTGGVENYEYSIRVKATGDSKEADKIVTSLREKVVGKTFSVLKQDYVGPIIGEQIRSDGLKALIGAVLCILAYVSFRFEWRFAVGAVAALVHDVVVTAGMFLFSGQEVSVAVLAALLTIIGYSINDTIVILDRVRENMGEALKKGGKDARANVSQRFGEILNDSLNQTFSRTILTSLTVLFVVLALWIFGGGAVEDLALSLVIGTIAGVYSTLFIVTPIVYYLKR